MPDMPNVTILGYLGALVFVAGVVLILAGTSIVSMTTISIKPGTKTWAVGTALVVIGILFALPDIRRDLVQPSPTPMPTETAVLSPSPSITPTNTPTPSYTPTARPTPIPSPSPTPSATPTVATAVLAPESYSEPDVPLGYVTFDDFNASGPLDNNRWRPDMNIALCTK